MTLAPPAPLWLGRTAALLGILLMALNLRTAVAALSPILSIIDRDIPLDSVAVGVLGALPPIAFSLSGILAPRIAHRIGLERALLAACAAMVAGHVLRVVGDSYALLLIGSIVALAGMGFGNILLPPAVKRYFPDRIPLVTASYATLMSISTAAPAIFAAPVAGGVGWRGSLAVWALLSVTALVPWLVIALRQRRVAAAAAAADEPVELEAVQPALAERIWRSRVAWSITLAFIVPTVTSYSIFAWLPTILIDTAGSTPTEAGALLALFGILGLPLGLLMPGITARTRNVGLVIGTGIALFVSGAAGLILAPAAAPILWVALVGASTLTFTVCITLINLRTRSPRASIALSGFMQSIGYGCGALGPLMLGFLHAATGGWTAPLLVLCGIALAGIVPAVMLARPSMLEDDLGRIAAARR